MSNVPTVKKIKTEPNDIEDDVENSLPKFVINPTLPQPECLEGIIDLTDEQYMNEFKNFLTTLPERRVDKEARRHNTKAKRKTVVQHTLCLPVNLLEKIYFQQDTYICELFHFTFTNVMLYGLVRAETVKDNSSIYQVDDGTGVVDVFYQPNKKYSDNLTKLAHCDELLCKKSTPMNEECVPESPNLRTHLRLLVRLAKEQYQKRLNRISLGTKCFIVGQAFLGREDKVCVFAHSVLPDDEQMGSCDLFWKVHLLSIYEPLIAREGSSSGNH